MVGGNWHLGIGDPTVEGWLVCFAYAGAAFLCWRAHRSCRYGQHALARSVPSEASRQERLARWWLGATLLLALLALNKQLDLQMLLTDLGRWVASAQGWYGARKLVQFAFIALLGAAAVAGAAALAWYLRAVIGRIVLAAAGMALLLGFVLLRAAAFHHVGGSGSTLDAWGWLLEAAGAALIAIGAHRSTVPVHRATA